MATRSRTKRPTEKRGTEKPSAAGGLRMLGGAAAGAAVGALAGPAGAAVGAVVGSVAGAKAKRVLESRPVKTLTAATEKSMGKVLSRKGPSKKKQPATAKKSAKGRSSAGRQRRSQKRP